MADIRELLLAAFEVEHREHVDAMRAALALASQGERIDLREAFRRAHSLKGAARAVDVKAIEEAAHAIEADFARAQEAGMLEPAVIARAGQHLDTIERAAEALYRRQDAVEAQDETQAARVMRIDAQAVHAASQSLNRLAAQIDLTDSGAETLRDVERQAEDVARRLETSSDPVETLRLARALARSAQTAGRQQRETARSLRGAAARLREEVDRLSLVPASSVFAGLDVMLRDLAAEAGREVDVKIEGLDTQADRALLQALRDPVIHLLRNAVAHGIEPPAERLAAGKPARGEISLSLSARAGRLEVKVQDDGRGPDLARIEAAAVARGLLPKRGPDDPAPAAGEVLALAFEAGLSTADAVDHVAGRGVGLSVVAETARRLGGSASLARRRPAGAVNLISTPLSAGLQPVLLVEAAGQVYGLPTYALEGVVRRRPAEVGSIDGRATIKFSSGGNQVEVPVVDLHRVVRAEGREPAGRKPGGPVSGAEGSDSLQIAIMRQGEQRLGVVVDALRQVRAEAVVSLGHPDLDEMVQGAVIIDRGEAALVLDPDSVMRRHSRGGAFGVAAAQAARETRRRTILVVDDSVTTRTLEKGILELSGYDVILAVDGVEALDKLHAARVDLVVADVEMPRMDGFQLLAAIKRDAALAGLPVIMMTSRADEEDVRRGMELGADAYLVKQAFDQRELLDVVGQLL